MKLKTLEGLELGIGEHEEIRAEAVKWVDEHRDNMWEWTEYTWRDFFNIEEKGFKNDRI